MSCLEWPDATTRSYRQAHVPDEGRTLFKSLTDALKELECFVRNGFHLQSGRPFTQLGGMRSREALANWLLCVSANDAIGEHRLNFTSDPAGGDGIIFDTETGETVQTEHVYIPSPRVGAPANNVEAQILQAVDKKRKKGGGAYASGKTLVVFSDSVGQWFPNRVARRLPNPLYFDMVWVVVSLHGVEN